MDKVGFWNIRGMNRSRKRKELNFFLKNKEVGLFGLLETKIKNKALLRAVENFESWCVSTNNGYHAGGRIWIVWQPAAFRIHFIEYNAQYIHIKVESLLNRNWFYLTMVYAFNSIQERESLWHNLRKIAQYSQGPWAIAGDFNCVLNATEMVGGNVATAEMGPFKACVEDCGVIDIKSVGSLFTWNNKQKPENRIYSRIDRFMINKDRSDAMPEAFAHFLPEGTFDHTPCIVRQSNSVQRKSSFKYFNMWGASDKFMALIKQYWSRSLEGTHMFTLARNLKILKPVLRKLNKESYCDIEATTEALKNKVGLLQEEIGQDPTNKHLIEEEHRILQELKNKTEARDAYLAQKAKQKWYQEGDTNSSYFHGMIKDRRNGNKVVMVEDMKGRLCDTPDGIREAFLEYYKQLLGRR
ncbi:hypothetical protein vseg_017718 [Gypsophila vaccaria]